MLKKTITYTDFFGETRTEDFYFNLTKTELVKTELGYEGGMEAAVKRLMDANVGSEIVAAFEDILKKAYGVRSSDGKSFIKNDEVWEAFYNSAAYDVLFMELLTDESSGANFIKAIMPQDLSTTVAPVNGFRPGHEPDPRQPGVPQEASFVAEHIQDVPPISYTPPAQQDQPYSPPPTRPQLGPPTVYGG